MILNRRRRSPRSGPADGDPAEHPGSGAAVRAELSPLIGLAGQGCNTVRKNVY